MLGFDGENAREKVIVLFTMCFALAMAMLDNTVVNVALPSIESELESGLSGLQWIVDGYVLAFASLLLTGGILGDKYGRKRLFLIGLAVFTLSSLFCGLSQTTEQLIVARALQGVGAALLMPGTLSIITVTFPPRERAKAIGLWAGVSGLALALGPTLGGYLVEHVGWQSVFFINVPIGIVAFAVAAWVVRESRSEQARYLDVPGLVLGSLTLFLATFGLIEANQRGWTDPLIVASLAGAAALLVGFLMWERRAPHAMMPLDYFRIPAFSAGNTVAFCVSLGMFATFFFLSLYMQGIHGYSPFQAGVRFLPMTLAIVVTAPLAGQYASQHGSRAPDDVRPGPGGGGLLLLGLTLQAEHLLPLPPADLRDHGPRDGRDHGSDDGGRHERRGPAAGGARLGHDEHQPRGGRRARHRVARHRPHHPPAIRVRPGPIRPRSVAGTGSRHRRGGRTRAGRPGAPARPHAEQQAGIAQAFSTAFMDGFHVALVIGGVVLLVGALVANRFIPGRETIEQHHADAEALAAAH